LTRASAEDFTGQLEHGMSKKPDEINVTLELLGA
jgi:hypothetical protein